MSEQPQPSGAAEPPEEEQEYEYEVVLNVACYTTVTVYVADEDAAREYAREDISKMDLEIDYIDIDSVTKVEA